MNQNVSLHNKPFYIIRHGETDWNKEHKVMGQTNIQLNENGVLQVKTVADKIQTLAIDIIVTSPLQRAKETAKIIAAKINKPIIIESDLKECCWGIMEGKVKGDASYKNLPFEPEKWWQEV